MIPVDSIQDFIVNDKKIITMVDATGSQAAACVDPVPSHGKCHEHFRRCRPRGRDVVIDSERV